MRQPEKTELDALRREGYTRPMIAAHYERVWGEPVSLSKVKRWLSQAEAAPRLTKAEVERARPKLRVRERNRPVALDNGETLMDKARVLLGDRLGENHIGYTLDGRPANTWVILRTAGLSVAR